jgi:hypothetical protein
MKYLFEHKRGVVISEQVSPLDRDRKINVDLGIGKGSFEYEGKKSRSAEFSSENLYYTNQFKNKTYINKEIFDKNVNKELSNSGIVERTLNGQSQIDLWNEILENDMYFAADVIRFVRKRKWIKETVLGKITGGEKTEPIVNTGDTKDPYLTIESIDDVTSDYFRDNHYDITPQGINDIEENYIKPILQSLRGSGTDVPVKACLKYLKISTSSSRFRNTGGAANLTYLQLSERRSKAIEDYVMKRLKDIGVESWCDSDGKSIIDSRGGNGDGTTGPNPPVKYGISQSGKNSDYKYDETIRNEFGTPLRDKSAYDVFKYNKLSIGVIFTQNVPPIKTDDEFLPGKEIESNEYFARFIGETKRKFKLTWRWKFPKFIFTRNKKVKTGTSDCPDFKLGNGKIIP